MIVLEITGLDAAGAATTFYFSDSQFVTSPTDTPANTAFYPDLLDPGSIGLHLFSDGMTGGAAGLEIGEIVIANTSGAYDNWLSTYGFDGQVAKIRVGAGGAYPAAFPAVFTGAIEALEADFSKMIVRVQDRRKILDKPLQATTFAGNNVLPNGLEGTADDIKDSPKPRLYGSAFNIPAICVNTAKLIYQVSDKVGFPTAVYDAGVPLTLQSTVATLALLQSTAPPDVGKYYACSDGGAWFRLRSTPAGQVTCDAVASAGGGTVFMPSDVVSAIAVDAGLPLIEQNAADASAMNTSNPQTVGIYVADTTTAADAIEQVLASIGGAVFFDGDGMLRRGVLTAPTGTPALVLRDYDIQGVPQRRPARDVSIPAWSVTVEHSKVYTVQTSGLAAACTDARRAFVARERRSVVATDTGVQTQHRLADAITVQTLLAHPSNAATDAAAEAARLLALYKVNRSFFDVTVNTDLVTGTKFLDVVQIIYPRLGMTSGKLFRLVGTNFDFRKRQVVLTLWG